MFYSATIMKLIRFTKPCNRQSFFHGHYLICSKFHSVLPSSHIDLLNSRSTRIRNIRSTLSGIQWSIRVVSSFTAIYRILLSHVVGQTFHAIDLDLGGLTFSCHTHISVWHRAYNRTIFLHLYQVCPTFWCSWNRHFANLIRKALA